MLGRKALLFASEDDLKELRGKLTDYLPFIRSSPRRPTWLRCLKWSIRNSSTPRRQRNAENDALIKALPMLEGIIKQATESLQRPGTPPSPGITALFGAGDEDIYITFAKLRIYLVTAQAKREDTERRRGGTIAPAGGRGPSAKCRD